MVIAATQSVVVHLEAVIGSEEVKRIVSLAELFQPFDGGLPFETSIEPTRRWSRLKSRTGVKVVHRIARVRCRLVMIPVELGAKRIQVGVWQSNASFVFQPETV